VIDDEPGMLRAVERILSPEHQVSCTGSSPQGLEMCAGVKPDLVICDISMPQLDGFDLLQRLKAAQPDLDVILMTALSDPDAHMVRAIREKAFYFIEKPFNRDVMRTLVERCLELRRLRDAERQHRARVDRELTEARVLQETMLPELRASVEGIEIDARCVACSELGGDMFDYASAGPASAAVMIADVAGHGVSAAMLTAVVKSAFGSSSAEQFEPRAVVRRVARDIAHFSARRFVTLTVARLDRNAMKLDYVNAGHPPGLLWGAAAQLTTLDPTGPLISPAFGDDEWEQETIELAHGSNLLLYTDGITEAAGESGQFSRERLIDMVRRSSLLGSQFLDEILRTVRAHCGGRPQVDDLTLLAATVP
jgi:sigma-B regulation protein RsbU (phosphoserine phosphatase)